ncbi:FAD-binding and (Fe-S)-binding domain-containing protein [Ensifer sp. BR816]|uniref:D-2-hydroxyglutarate dehydrogenase YdiJ n=1 Tax=Rhizobium sp. (strain BR816) TaxID=1057002 RepID=UPI0003656426|nr:FAD-binding and (Fe-S)-binding domain-containing protein [Ensifer sp. BR816]
MIPALAAGPKLGPPYADYLDALRHGAFAGDIEDNAGSTTVFATDNSIYQLRPQAVLFPRQRADLMLIARLAAEPRFRGVAFAMRGGGTGTNGQSLTDGIVIDMSRHMNRILSIDPVRRTAVVEAGVVKDQLNKALKSHGLFFAPELSTSNRATIGGMISTDACGQGSCIYGKTSNHVLALNAVLMDGTEWLSRPLAPDALPAVLERSDRVGEVHRLADAIERENRDLIGATFPKLNRFLTGYDLAHLRTEDGGLNLNAVLCGAEGTLAMIAEAELNLLPIPRFAALINIRYDDFDAALRDARFLVELKVASVETIDAKVLSLARNDIVWESIARFFADERAGHVAGINIVELLADDEEGLRQKLDQVTSALSADGRPGRRGFTLAMDRHDIEAIWTMRKRAVGLLGNVEGPRRPIAFVEDTAVPPEHLADYIAEFRALLDAEGLDYGMFGHVDAGVLHVRPALDLTDERQEPLVRRVSDAVAKLTRKYGGVFWGEHGKGVRSEYAPDFFGPLYPELQRLKAAFDPHNQLNPGKIATPGHGALTRIDELPLRGAFDRRIDPDTRQAFDNAAFCNGNGACFDFNADSAMCPSFKGTGDRRFSPKGRASLIREWLRLMAERGVDLKAEAETLRGRRVWRGLLSRLLASLGRAKDGDFSHQVRAAMDTCLACKACAGQCPVKVNVPAFRSKFLELYYGRYLRPLKDPLIASIEHLLPAMAKMGWLYNLVAGTRPGRALMGKVGLTALPLLSKVSVPAELRRRGVAIARPAELGALSASEKERSVILVQDSFTSYFEPALLLDVIDLLLALGFKPFVAPLKPNGKALHVHGYLGAFERTAERNARHLSQLAAIGVPLVGLDPSMTLCYRSEYPVALGAVKTPAVLLPQEWLSGRLEHLAACKADRPETQYVLLPHCTERTNAADSVRSWGAIFEAFGLKLTVEDAGCCGMAGTFGHERKNRSLSETIYGLSWRKKVEDAGLQRVLMATGYSCRSQVKLMGSPGLPHPLQLLKALVCDVHNSHDM